VPLLLPSHFTPVLLAIAVNSIDGWDRITSGCTVSDSSATRNGRVVYYGLTSKRHCQFLEEKKTKHLLNLHIWPNHNKNNLVLLDLHPTDIDQPKNILHLHHPMEHSFDHNKHFTLTQSRSDFLLYESWIQQLEPRF
jgi:hypothetical protein